MENVSPLSPSLFLAHTPYPNPALLTTSLHPHPLLSLPPKTDQGKDIYQKIAPLVLPHQNQQKYTYPESPSRGFPPLPFLFSRQGRALPLGRL